MADTEREVIDVLILGAGFTGLTAARELDRRGIPFRVLDAFPDHLGGRAFSYDPGLGAGRATRFDHGAQYVGDTQNDIMQLVRELLPPDALVNGANLRFPHPHQVVLAGGERHVFKLEDSAFGIKGVPPDLGLAGALAFVGLLAEMMLVEIRIDVLEPWKGDDDLLELDRVSITAWLDDKPWVPAVVRDLLRLSVEALLSVEPEEISIYFLLWYSACNNGFLSAINDDTAGPQQYWLKYGMSTLAERYATPVRGRIRQGVRARRVDLSGEHVAVTTDAGETILARKVLVAMSPHTAGRIAYTPDPPAGRRALMAMPMGRTLKCQVFYRSAWWHDVRGTDFNGYGGGPLHRVLWTMDNSPDPSSGEDTHVIMTFTVGAKLDELGPSPTQAEIEAWVTRGIRDFFDDDRALHTSSEFVKLVAYRWDAADRYVGGGPNTVFPVGKLTSVGRHMNEAWDDRVFFASAENALNTTPTSTSPRWNPLHDDVMPKYSKDGLHFADPFSPYRTNYSDMRQSLGYLDGAIVAGRWVAEEIATSLLADAARPRPAAAEAPPRRRAPQVRSAGPRAPTIDDAGVLEAIRADLEAASPDDVRAWLHRPASPKGYGAFVHQSLVKALGDDGGDPVRRLEMVRDFCAAVAPLAASGDASPPAEDLPILERVRRAVAGADEAVRRKLGLA